MIQLTALIQQVRNIWKAWRVSRAFKVLNKYKVQYWTELPVTTVEKEITILQETVDAMVDQVEEKFKKEAGEFKRAQVLRAVMNILPDALERDIAFAIEKKIQQSVN